MDVTSAKVDLKRWLQDGREVLLWKLDGLSEYDARRPLVPTGTNLLGLVKHMAAVEAGYFGLTFGRPLGEAPEWMMAKGDDPMVDMWATADEPRDDIVGLYRRVWAHADATIDELSLDAAGRVPWWGPDSGTVTLHRILVHVATENHRHAGHADILRELIDGGVGYRSPGNNLPDNSADGWAAHRARVEEAARAADAGS